MPPLTAAALLIAVHASPVDGPAAFASSSARTIDPATPAAIIFAPNDAVPTVNGPAIAAGDPMNNVGVPGSTAAATAFTVAPSNATCDGLIDDAFRSASVIWYQYLPVVLSKMWTLNTSDRPGPPSTSGICSPV